MTLNSRLWSRRTPVAPEDCLSDRRTGVQASDAHEILGRSIAKSQMGDSREVARLARSFDVVFRRIAPDGGGAAEHHLDLH